MLRGVATPWKLISIVGDNEKALGIAKGLNPEDYNHYLIIEHDIEGNWDFPYDNGFLNNNKSKKEEKER